MTAKRDSWYAMFVGSGGIEHLRKVLIVGLDESKYEHELRWLLQLMLSPVCGS